MPVGLAARAAIAKRSASGCSSRANRKSQAPACGKCTACEVARESPDRIPALASTYERASGRHRSPPARRLPSVHARTDRKTTPPRSAANGDRDLSHSACRFRRASRLISECITIRPAVPSGSSLACRCRSSLSIGLHGLYRYGYTCLRVGSASCVGSSGGVRSIRRRLAVIATLGIEHPCTASEGGRHRADIR